MKLTIFAATGGIGRLILEQALAAGHEVTAVARHPEGLPAQARLVAVDLAAPDTPALEAAVRGADAVISGLGPRPLAAARAGITSKGTQAIIRAMRAVGARRLVVVSAAPVGTVPSPGNPHPPKHDPSEGFFTRHLLGPLVKAIMRTHYADLALMEDHLRESDLDWTSVRPPRLTNGRLTGTYRTAIGRNVPGGGSLSRADTAQLMLAVLARPETIGQTVAGGY